MPRERREWNYEPTMMAGIDEALGDASSGLHTSREVVAK